MGQDKITKALAFDQTIRIYSVVATETVAEIKARTMASPIVSVALGRLAMGSLLVGALDSAAAKIYTRVDGKGPVGTMYADSDAQGNVRAYATNPTAVLPVKTGQWAVDQVVGHHGFLYVIKDLGLKEYFTSETELVHGDINRDFAKYFSKSMQTTTKIFVDVQVAKGNVTVAGGFIAQALPGASAEAMKTLKDNIDKIPSMTAFLKKHTPSELVNVLAGGCATTLETLPVQFHCDCSKERFLRGFATLPRAELEAMLAHPEDEEVVCQYCNETYYITNQELAEILAQGTDRDKEGKEQI